MKTITRSLRLGLSLLWFTNLCLCDVLIIWKPADSFGDQWKDKVAGLPEFVNQHLMLLKHKNTNEAYFQGDRVDGNTDYAIANLKLPQIVKIRVTQEEIFRAAAIKQSAHLINSNTKFFKKLPLTNVFFTKFERDLTKYSETIKNISDNAEKMEKFQLIHNLMKKITRLHNMTPKYYFESDVTTENLQICAFVFDATVLETWAHTHRFYFTGHDSEEESSTDLPEEDILATQENIDEPAVDNNSPESAVIAPDATKSLPEINPAGKDVTNAQLNSTIPGIVPANETPSVDDYCLDMDTSALMREQIGGGGTSIINQGSCGNQGSLTRAGAGRSPNGATLEESEESKEKPTLERGYIRKNGFGIAVVIIKGGATETKLSFFGSHVLVAKCTNSRYVNKLVRLKFGGDSWDILQSAGIAKEFTDKNYESVEMIDFIEDVNPEVTLSFHKYDGTTDYAVVERNVQSGENTETKIKYRAPQELICREMAKDMCLDLLRANKSRLEKFCDWFNKKDEELVRGIKLETVNKELFVNKFLQQIVKQFMGVTPEPRFNNAIWEEDIKYINLHDALLEIIAKRTTEVLDYENAEIRSFHQNGFGIALVLANGPDFNIDGVRQYDSNVLLARVKNQTYIQEILTKNKPNIVVRAGALFGNAFKTAFHGVKTALQKIVPWSWCNGWESGFSYKWEEVRDKLSVKEQGNGCLCMQYGSAADLRFFQYYMGVDKSLLVVVWIDEDFPDKITIVKKGIINPKKIAEEKEKTTKPSFFKRAMTKAASAANLLADRISNACSKNPYKDLVSKAETEEKTKNVPNEKVKKYAGAAPILEAPVMDTDTGLIVEETLNIGCSGYKGWKAVEDRNPHRPLELYLQGFVELYCKLEHYWKILLVKKTNHLSRNKYLMVYGIHYEFLEENMNKPWFDQKNYSYFCALIKKNPRNKLTASRDKGSDPAKRIIAALAYGQESWDAIPIVYDLQDEYIRLHKAPIYPDFQYLLQVGVRFRAAYYTISDGIGAKGYRVKNYTFIENVWTEEEFKSFYYPKASQEDELLTPIRNEVTSPAAIPTAEPKGSMEEKAARVLLRTEKKGNLGLIPSLASAAENHNTPIVLPPEEDVPTCALTAVYQNRRKWKNVCRIAGYTEYNKLNFIQFDSSDPIHFYLLEANVPTMGFKYLLLIAYIDDTPKNITEHLIVVLHKAKLTEEAFVKFTARRNFVGLFKRWYHTQTIMHRTVGQKILFDEIELEKYVYPLPKNQPPLRKGMNPETKKIEDKEAVVLLSTRYAAFQHVLQDERNKFDYYKSNVYFDQKYGFHYLRAFVFQKTMLSNKAHKCTGIGKILPIFWEKRVMHTSLAESDNVWRTVVMMTKADFVLRDMKPSALVYGSGTNPVETADNDSEVKDPESESENQDQEEFTASFTKSAKNTDELAEKVEKFVKEAAEAADKHAEKEAKDTKQPIPAEDIKTQNKSVGTNASAAANPVKSPAKQTPEEGSNPPSTATDKKPTKKENRVNHYKVFRYQRYDEDKDLKRWALEETPAFTGWIPIKFFGGVKDDLAYYRLQSYLWEFAYLQYSVSEFWTVLLVKERTKFVFRTRYYLVFGYHGKSKDHKHTGQKYFCAMVHKDYKYLLAMEGKTNRHGVVIALAFDLDALDVIGTAMELEDAYLAQQNDVMGVAHLASLTLNQAGNLFPVLQHLVQRDKQFREFHYKLNTNVDTIGYFVLMYTYDVDRKAWIGCKTKTFGTGDYRYNQLVPHKHKVFNKITEKDTTTSTANTPTATSSSTANTPSATSSSNAKLPTTIPTSSTNTATTRPTSATQLPPITPASNSEITETALAANRPTTPSASNTKGALSTPISTANRSGAATPTITMEATTPTTTAPTITTDDKTPTPVAASNTTTGTKPTPVNSKTLKETVDQIPELAETYEPLPELLRLPLWKDIATLDESGLVAVQKDSQMSWDVLKNRTFQEEIQNRLKFCGCTIVNKEDVKKVNFLKEQKADSYAVYIGISEDSYFYLHRFGDIILFYRPDIPSYVGALSAAENYWADIVDWISVTSDSTAIPKGIADVLIELEEMKTDSKLPIGILYYADIPNVGSLAIFVVGNNYYLLRLDIKTGQRKWGFKCQRVETLLRIRKSYVMTNDGWNAYEHHVELIWLESPYPGNRKRTPKHAPALYNIFGQLGRLREWALGKLYRKIQSPLKFEERKNRLRIWLADSLQKDPIIESYGVYRKHDEHSAKFVKDINGAGGEDLSSDMKQMFALISIKDFAEKPEQPTTPAVKVAEMFRIHRKTAPVSPLPEPPIERYQVVNMINFMNVDLDFALGGYSSPFFPIKELAQDAVGLENMLNGY